MNRPQRVLVSVALAVFFVILHAIGTDFYHRREDPGFAVILLFRVHLMDFVPLVGWFVPAFGGLRRW